MVESACTCIVGDQSIISRGQTVASLSRAVNKLATIQTALICRCMFVGEPRKFQDCLEHR